MGHDQVKVRGLEVGGPEELEIPNSNANVHTSGPGFGFPYLGPHILFSKAAWLNQLALCQACRGKA